MASIPVIVVNLLADARVARVGVGRGGAWIGSFERAFDRPVRLENAVLFVSAFLGGLRSVSIALTSGERLWLGHDFRFRSLERASPDHRGDRSHASTAALCEGFGTSMHPRWQVGR